MKYSVELSKEAVISIRKASDYYLEIHADLKDDFIKEHPFHFQIRYRGIKNCAFKKVSFGDSFYRRKSNCFCVASFTSKDVL